jgi:nucleotide-binding universal stress UspA family protein
MKIRDVLIHADSSDDFESRLTYALTMADKNGAHLTALYVVPRYTAPAYVGVPMDPVIIQQANDQEWGREELARKRFTEVATKYDCNTEWRSEEGDPVHHLNVHGRYFDLTLLSQTDPSLSDGYFSGLAGDLSIGLGRPCLVLPNGSTTIVYPKRILVAWNGSHASARAINDAMPLLEQAELVEVISLDSSTSSLDEDDLPASDICLHLARHGVNAEAKGIQIKGVSKGQTILSHASHIGADMVVMGCYGHSRLREIILGGTTHYILKHMTVPIFLSH